MKHYVLQTKCIQSYLWVEVKFHFQEVSLLETFHKYPLDDPLTSGQPTQIVDQPHVRYIPIMKRERRTNRFGNASCVSMRSIFECGAHCLVTRNLIKPTTTHLHLAANKAKAGEAVPKPMAAIRSGADDLDLIIVAIFLFFTQ